MRHLILAALLVGAMSTGATAQTFTSVAGQQTAPTGSTIVNFDSPLPNGFSLNGGAIVQGNVISPTGGFVTTPAGDSTKYLAVYAGGQAGLVADKGYRSVSFYWGTVDPFNSASFFDTLGNLVGTLTGAQVAPNGAAGQYVTYSLPATALAGISGIVFGSTKDAFELDDVAFAGSPGNPAPVPEPGTMALFALAVGGLAWMTTKRRAGAYS